MSKDETARRGRTVPGGRYTNHVGHSLGERDRKVAIYDLQRERAEEYNVLFEACKHESKRQILAALYINDGVATYNELDDLVNRHRSNIKKHVGELDQSGLVDRSGNPAVVSFSDTDIALLASDTLNVTDPL